MKDITLVKLQSLNNEMEVLMNGPLMEQVVYVNLIDSIQRVEIFVELNKVHYKDAAKMITLCKFMTFNLMLKITELLEDGVVGLQVSRH